MIMSLNFFFLLPEFFVILLIFFLFFFLILKIVLKYRFGFFFNFYNSYLLLFLSFSFWLIVLLFDLYSVLPSNFRLFFFYNSFELNCYTVFSKLIISLFFYFFNLTLLIYKFSFPLRKNSFNTFLSFDFEFFLFFLLSLFSSFVIVCCSSFILFYVSIELQSIILYCLIALDRGSVKAPEASLKYLIFGIFSSSFLLIFIVLVYGFSGTFNI